MVFFPGSLHSSWTPWDFLSDKCEKSDSVGNKKPFSALAGLA